MQYRKFGQLDWQVSALGFGVMRMPVIEGDAGQIDENEATRMLRHAIDLGVNYVDTAYPYHQGTSESFLGKALQDGYRERVRVATKMPAWLIETPADFDRYLDEQLERLQMPAVDFYLLHGLEKERWAKLQSLDVLAWAERTMAAGRFHHFGFSFHDSLDMFKSIVDAYDNWALAQVQYNLMDVDYQAGTAGVRYAADKGLAVVVMEPIRGGMLARTPPAPVVELWRSAPVQRTPADWALRWVWNHPEVAVVLSGMSTMQHVEENLATASDAQPDSLTDEELALIAQVRAMYQELAPIPCTNCQYCQPCPSGVRIPHILTLYNEAHMYNDPTLSRLRYGWLKPEERADACVECGNCEALCPQSIAIIEWLARAHEFLMPPADQ